MAYLAIALTGTLAAYRSRGFLRVWLAYDVVMSVLLKLYTILASDHVAANHVYKLAWMVAEPIGMVLAACAALTRCTPRWWIAVPALLLHAFAAGYPQRWPGSWLHAEIHAVAFCCLLFGLALVATCKKPLHVQNAALTLLFLGTSAALYPAPWQPAIRGYLMYHQAACYLWLAVAQQTEIQPVPARYC